VRQESFSVKAHYSVHSNNLAQSFEALVWRLLAERAERCSVSERRSQKWKGSWLNTYEGDRQRAARTLRKKGGKMRITVALLVREAGVIVEKLEPTIVEAKHALALAAKMVAEGIEEARLTEMIEVAPRRIRIMHRKILIT